MAKNCIKYGKNTYKPNILFDKIRSNPEFFAKKHGIKGSDVESVLGIGKSNKVDFQIIGEKGAQNLSDAENIMANNKIAKEMEEAGKDAKTIRLATGWEKGGDGKWRYEILDGKLSPFLKTDEDGRLFKTMELGNLFKNNELYIAYPYLENLNTVIRINPNYKNKGHLQSNDYGYDSEGQKTIVPSEIKIESNNIDEANSIIIHEIQHAIQFYEGFAKGGNINDSGVPKDMVEDISKVEYLLADALKRINSGNWLYEGLSISEIIDTDDTRSENIKSWAKNIANEGEATIQEFLKDTPYGRYKRLSGEVESRNVQTRANMSNEERLSTLLFETEDIPRDEQIQIFESSGLQASISNPAPQKPKNLMPKSLIANIADTIRNGGKSAEVMNIVNNSNWFKGLGESTKANLTFNDVKSTLIDSDNFHRENDKVKAKERTDANIKAVKKTYKEKIADLREVYKNKINEAKNNTTKTLKEKVADRLFHRKQAINGIKLLLSDKSIRDKVTHTDMIRLLGSAEQIYGARDFNKAFTEFEIKLESVITRAEKRLEKKKTDDETKSELYKQIEGNVRSMVDNNAELKDIEAYYPDVNQRQLAVNAYNRIKNETISFTDAVKGVEEAKKQESDIINQNKSWTQRLKNWKEKFITNSIDRQWLPKKYLREIGASNTENRMINMAGASAKAKHIFDIAYDKIFYGLNKEERSLLDSIIQQRRIIAIDGNREERNLAPILHPNNQDKNTANAFLDAKKQELGEEKYNDLVKRSDAYFDSFRDLLGEMKSEGMINQDAYDSMVDIDYQPRLFLEHLLDYDGKFANEQDKSFRLEGAGLSKDLIRSLDEGSTGVLLSNSELLLATAITSRQQAIMANRMNKEFIQNELPKAKARFEAIPDNKVQQYEKNIADNKISKSEEERFYRYFKELDSKIIDNPITGANKNGNPVYKNETTPQGYKKAYYYDNGVRNEFFMEENLHDMWHDTIKGYISSGAKQNISMVTGSALIKTMATGNNPAFVIVNTPRDFVHTLAFSTEYSSFIPKGVWNLVTDLAKSVGEIRKYDKGDNSLMSKYMEYGGGMDFLNTQGMLKADSLLAKGINSLVDAKQQDLAKKVMSVGTAKILSRYSETMFRVAVFKRAIDNRVKEEGKKNPDVKTIEDLPKDQQDYIYDYAVRQARDLMDFNQGGRVVKDAEAFIPYINAATQGTRVMFEQFRRNPVATTSKMLQITGMTVSGVIGMAMLAIAKFRDDDDERTSVGIFLDFRETLSPYQRENYFNIPTGYDRAAGTYKMTSIAKAQSFTPILSLTESIVENQMRRIEGKDEMSWKTMMGRVGFAFTNNVDPVGFSGLFTDGEGLKSIPDTGAKIATRNPLMKAMMTYATGYDFFFGQPLQDTQNKTLHNYEGSGSSKVEDFYKTLGINTGLSPIRTKAAVEGIVTSPTTNPFVGLMYGIADVALTDKSLLESVKGISSNDDGEFKASKLPVLNRLFRETSNYSRQLNVSAEIKGSSEFKSALEKEAQMKMKSDEIASRYKTPDALLKDAVNVRAEILDFSKKDTNIAEKMAKRIEGKVSRKDLDGRVWDIAYDTGTSNEAKAMLIMAYFGDVRGNAKIQSDLKEAKVWSKKVQEEYVKLLGSK